ncbi:MAG TPA: hypothetical protein VF950_18760 [Planctomycetota bacterium]
MEPDPRKQRLALLAVCGVIMTVGLSIFVPSCLMPILDFFEMRKWQESPCEIVREGVFAYEVHGVRLESSRLGLDGMFCPPRSLWDLKPGSTSVCYVNPRDTGDAVLFRDLDGTIFLGFAPLLFVLFPGAALVLGWRNIGRPPPPEPPPVLLGPVPPSAVLQARRAGGCAVFGVFFFLLFLGGVLALLWVFGGLLHLVIAVPFSLMWLALLKLLFRLLLAKLNPRVQLTLTPGRGTPDGEIDVRWDVVGGLRDVRRFTLELVVREELSGKSSRSEPIAAKEVASGAGKLLRKGSTRLTLPQAMHSFHEGRASVVWVFRLTGEVALGPDVDDEFLLDVGPLCR